MANGVQPSVKGGATRHARRERREHCGKSHALGGQLIDLGRANNVVPIAAEIARRHVVGDQEQNVGTVALRCDDNARSQKQPDRDCAAQLDSYLH